MEIVVNNRVNLKRAVIKYGSVPTNQSNYWLRLRHSEKGRLSTIQINKLTKTQNSLLLRLRLEEV